MADQKLSGKTSTAIVTGGYMYIIIPDGAGGWLPRKILVTSLQAALQTAITALQTYDAQATQTTKHAAKSADFTQILGSNVKLESIDIVWVSGTPTITVGTTLAGTDVLSSVSPTSGNDSINDPLTLYFSAATTLYFAVSGGVVNINVNYRNNYI